MRKYLRVVSISRAPHRLSTRQQSIRHYMPVAYLLYKHSIMSFRLASRNYLPQNNCKFTWINMHEPIMLNYDVLSESYYLIFWARVLVPLARNHRDVRIWKVPHDIVIITWMPPLSRRTSLLFFFSLVELELPLLWKLVRHSTEITLISSFWLIKVYAIWPSIAYYIMYSNTYNSGVLLKCM